MKGISIPTQDRNKLNTITDYPLQESYFIPVEQELYIKHGEYVQEGQLLTANIPHHELYHSPVSGTIVNILSYNFRKYIEIQRDVSCLPRDYPLSPPLGLAPNEQIERIKNAGITNDLHEQLTQKIDYVIINGLDSEPFVTNSYSILMQKAQEIIQTSLQLKQITNADVIVVAISKDSNLKKHLETPLLSKNIRLIEVPKKYPLHNEKLLINHLFKKELGKTDSVIDENILVLDVPIVYAIHEALFYQKPHIEKIISVEGAYSLNHGNFKVKIGTPISAFMRPFSVENSYVMFAGGVMTGTSLEKEKTLTKKINSIMIFEGKPQPAETPCISCSACVYNCPIRLEPVKLIDFINHQEHDKTHSHHIQECIQCNICTYVCPSFIPLGRIIRDYLEEEV